MKKHLLLLFLTGAILFGILTIPEAFAEENKAQTPKVITSFAITEEDFAAYTGKPGLKELTSVMPGTVKASLEGESSTADIPVTWECEEDYENTAEDYYIFYAVWDESVYKLSDTWDPESYVPFFEVQIVGNEADYSRLSESEYDRLLEESEESITPAEASEGISNIVSRAYHMINIPWTPLITVKGYKTTAGFQTAIHTKGRTYTGLPYGQQVNSGKYVPFSASMSTFINAVSDSSSAFYTSRGSYGTKNSLYYANDCSAFVSYCYGLKRMTTYTIARSSLFKEVTDNSIQNAEIGDCFNLSGSHVELITDMIYNSAGNLAYVEVCEQTPPMARSRVMTAKEVQKIINSGGYTLLRYTKRDSVKATAHYTGCYDKTTVEAGSEVTVEVGSRYVPTTFTWKTDTYAKRYELRLWKDTTCLSGAPDYIRDELTESSCSLQLPLGSYEGFVDSVSAVTDSYGDDYDATLHRRYVKFTVTAATPDSIGEEYAVHILMNSKKTMLYAYKTAVSAKTLTYTRNSAWNFEVQSDGSYVIRHVSDNTILTVADSSADSGAAVTCEAFDESTGSLSNGQKWYLFRCDTDTYYLKPKCSKCVLNYDSDGTMTVQTLNRSAAQQFLLYDCSSSHIWNGGKVSEAATCTQTGTMLYTCKICGKTKTKTIALIDHSYELTRVTKEATCSAKGAELWTCSVCGATKTISVAKLPHSYPSRPAVAPSCKGKQVVTDTCTVCGYTRTQTIAAISHTYNKGVVTKAPTYYNTGVRTYTCTVCGATKTKTIAKLNIQITRQPAAIQIKEGNAAKFTIKALGQGLRYCWQYRKNTSSAWVSSTGSTGKTASYTFSSKAKTKWNGYQIRCLLKDNKGHQLYSKVVKLTVKSAMGITKQPESVSVKPGSAVRFRVNASGSGLTYRWQYRKKSSASWNYPRSASAKTASWLFSSHVKKSHNGYQVRCIIKDKKGNVRYTKIVKVTVKS